MIEIQYLIAQEIGSDGELEHRSGYASSGEPLVCRKTGLLGPILVKGQGVGTKVIDVFSRLKSDSKAEG